MFLCSCNKLIFREINCRDFEFQDDLKWYAGNVGDTLTLSNKKHEIRKIVIIDKYLSHRKKYVSDTGCGCYDIWGMVLTNGSDTIIMNGESVYVEKNEAKRYDGFYIQYNNTVSGFIEEDKSIAINYVIDSITFAQVKIFAYSYTGNNQFRKIVIAPDTGIVELIETNGNVWKNVNLTTKLSIDISSFEYSENTCE
jgi:hypothetical protein